MRTKVNQIIPKLSVGNYFLRGVGILYLSLMIVLPIIALQIRAFRASVSDLIANLVQPEALYSLQLTFLLAFCMVIVDVITGTAMAWVLVRYEFPGKTIVNSLIDLPFAIPTVVTGLMLVVLYGPQSAVGRFLTSRGIEVIYAKPGIILALLFVTLPFVVRTVQPVLMALDQEMEEAAITLGASRFYTFRTIVLPALYPAILTGAAQAFSRALGEFGSVVIVAGNIPMKTQVSAVYIYSEIESYNPTGAVAVSLVLLAISFVILVILKLLERKGSHP